MIGIYLYGKFREMVPGYTIDSECKLEMETQDEETVSSIMDKLGIRADDVAHIFLNHQYSSPSRKVRSGDRLAIFPIEMAVLYRQYFVKHEE